MKEVKSPKKPLIYYYSIILLIVLLFNLIVSPLLMKNQVTEVDYGTFMRMIEEKTSEKSRSRTTRSSLPTRTSSRSTRPARWTIRR